MASARRVPASSRASPLNAAVPASSSATANATPAALVCGRQPSTAPSADDDHHLEDLDGQHGQGLGPDQPAAGQRGGAQPLEHPVAALEPGGDGLAGERGGQHGQGQDAGHHEVDPAAADGDQRLVAEGQEQQHRDDQRQQQLLAVAQQEAQLQAGLGADHAGQRRRPRRGAASPRPRRPAPATRDPVTPGPVAPDPGSARPAKSVTTAAPVRSAPGTRPRACGSRSAGSGPGSRGRRTRP